MDEFCLNSAGNGSGANTVTFDQARVSQCRTWEASFDLLNRISGSFTATVISMGLAQVTFQAGVKNQLLAMEKAMASPDLREKMNAVKKSEKMQEYMKFLQEN